MKKGDEKRVLKRVVKGVVKKSSKKIVKVICQNDPAPGKSHGINPRALAFFASAQPECRTLKNGSSQMDSARATHERESRGGHINGPNTGLGWSEMLAGSMVSGTAP